MPGTWDAPPTELEMRGSGSVWDAPPTSEELSGAPPAHDPGAVATYVTKAAQVPAMGFVDEAAGALGATANAIGDLPSRLRGEQASPWRDAWKSDYDSITHGARAQEHAGSTAHPVASGWGTGTGIVLSLMAPVPKGIAPFEAAKDAGALGKAGVAALNAAIPGALQGLGASESESLGGIASDAVLSGLMGAGLGGGLSLAGAALRAAPAKLREVAGSLAAKAPGKMLADYRALGDEPAAIEQGRHLLDRGLVKFGDNAEKIGARLGPAREQAGRAVGEAIEGLDRTGAKAPSGLDLARQIHQEVVQPLAKYPANRNIVKGLNDELEALVKQFGDTPLSFEEAEAIKRSYDPFLKWDSTVSNPSRAAMQALRGVINRSTEEAADQVAPVAGARFAAAKRAYGLIAPAEEASSDYVLRQSANRKISPSDYLAGASKMASGGDPVSAGVTAWVHKQLRERGNASAAVVADVLAKGLEAAPQAFGRYGQLLQQAAKKSPQALVALHQSLMDREPGYRQLMEEK